MRRFVLSLLLLLSLALNAYLGTVFWQARANQAYAANNVPGQVRIALINIHEARYYLREAKAGGWSDPILLWKISRNFNTILWTAGNANDMANLSNIDAQQSRIVYALANTTDFWGMDIFFSNAIKLQQGAAPCVQCLEAYLAILEAADFPFPFDPDKPEDWQALDAAIQRMYEARRRLRL